VTAPATGTATSATAFAAVTMPCPRRRNVAARADRRAPYVGSFWSFPHVRTAARKARGHRRRTGPHGRDSQSTCANRILERYLVDQLLPPRGTTYHPGIVPFATG
jgi:hypothetical protein